MKNGIKFQIKISWKIVLATCGSVSYHKEASVK